MKVHIEQELNFELRQLSRHLRINLLSWSYAQIPTAFNDTQVTKIQSAIRDLNKRPPAITKSDTIVPSTLIKIVHIHEAIQYANIRSILQRPQVSRLLPGNNGTKEDKIPMICDKQTLPSSTLLCNFSTTAKSLSPIHAIMPVADSCPCRTILLPNCTDLVDGHVMSTNYDYIRNDELRRQFYYGSVFKDNINSTSILESISLGINEYISKVSKPPTILTAQVSDNLEEWKQTILQSCEENLNRYRHKFKSNSQRGADAISHLKTLREHFTITKVDKLTHNLAFTCKQYYLHKLYSELFSDAYSPATNTFDEIIHRHQSFNAKYNYRYVPTLPYLYAIPKLHKSPPKLRYIAGVSSPIEFQPNTTPLQRIFNRPNHIPTCSTTTASKNLCRFLQSYITILKDKDDNFFKATGYRRLWFVTAIDDVFRDLKFDAPVLKGKKPRTFDFTQMYTKLPQQRILDNIRKAINEAQTYRHTLPANTTLPLLPDPDIVMDHLTFIVSNTFLGNDPDNLRQQTIGLPMGTNSAPEIANLCLYADESSFIDNLLSRQDFQTVRKYATTRRYIDDLLLWDLSPPPISTYGLEYSETTEPDGTVTFLGAQINTLSNGYISLAIYDKTSSWNFPVIRYTHGHSNVPTHQATGIVFSQLTRYRLICNSITNFKKATTSLVKKLLERDHPPSIILRGWERYLIRYSMHDDDDRNVALRTWFRKMIKWASYHIINPLHKRHQTSLSSTTNYQLPTTDTVLSTVGANVPEIIDDTVSMYNPSQLSLSYTSNYQHPTTDKILSAVGANTTEIIEQAVSMYNPSQVSPSPSIQKIPVTSTRSYADIVRRPSTIPTDVLSTNHIPTIYGQSKDSSILLSIDQDATKETLFINLQPIIQQQLQNNTTTEDMIISVTTFLKDLTFPTIGYSIKNQSESFQNRYYATNPNGACGYILAYQLHTRQPSTSPYTPTQLNLYNSTTRTHFLTFLQQQLPMSKDLEYKHKLSGVINWVKTNFNPSTRSSTRQPSLPREFWATDDFLLRFNIHTTFTYFINSNQHPNYLKCMFSSSTKNKVHYSYIELLSLVKTNSFIQHSSDHFFFLEQPNPHTLLTSINEATIDLAHNILTYFLQNPSAINATIKYYVAPCMDLRTPTQSPIRPSSPSTRQSSLLPPLLPPIIIRSSGALTPTRPTSLLPPLLPTIATRSSGAPTPTPTIADPSSNTTLFRYVNDPIFKSIRPYFYRISENARKRESGFDIPATQCTVCMQFFTKLNLHTSQSDSLSGCHNVARLRMYICHRKNIPLPSNTLPSALTQPTVDKLESYLMELN